MEEVQPVQCLGAGAETGKKIQGAGARTGKKVIGIRSR